MSKHEESLLHVSGICNLDLTPDHLQRIILFPISRLYDLVSRTQMNSRQVDEHLALKSSDNRKILDLRGFAPGTRRLKPVRASSSFPSNTLQIQVIDNGPVVSDGKNIFDAPNNRRNSMW